MRALLTGLLLLVVSALPAQTVTSIMNGDWNTPATWDCNCIPQPGDSVIIDHALQFATDILLDSTYLAVTAQGVLTGSPGARLAVDRLSNNGLVDVHALSITSVSQLLGLVNYNSIAVGTDLRCAYGFQNQGTLHVGDTLSFEVFSNNFADAFLRCGALVGDEHQNFGTDTITTLGAMLFRNLGGMSSLVVTGTTEGVRFSGEHARFLGDAVLQEFSLGDDCIFSADMTIAGPSNYISGQVQVYGSLMVDNNINLLDSNTLFTVAGDLVNNGSIYGSGAFCVAGTTENNGGIFGEVDICDLSPQTTIPPFIDQGQGIVAPTVTFCAAGHCGVGIAETMAGPALRVYPNPSVLHFQVEGVEPGMHYRLMDAQGREVLSGIVTAVDMPFLWGDLPSGAYGLQFLTGRERLAMTVVRMP